MLSCFPKVTHLASGGGRVQTQWPVLWAQLLARGGEKALARQCHVTCWPAQMWPSVWACGMRGMAEGQPCAGAGARCQGQEEVEGRGR